MRSSRGQTVAWGRGCHPYASGREDSKAKRRVVDREVEVRLMDQRVQEPRPAPGAACRACGGPAHTSLVTFLSAGSTAPSSGHTFLGNTHLCFASHTPGLHPQQRWAPGPAKPRPRPRASCWPRCHRLCCPWDHVAQWPLTATPSQDLTQCRPAGCSWFLPAGRYPSPRLDLIAVFPRLSPTLPFR